MPGSWKSMAAHGSFWRRMPPAKLYRAAGEILRSPELRRSMSAGMAELGIPDATERIYRTVMALRK